MRWKATPIIIAIYYLLFFVLILLHNAEFTTAFCVSKKISYQLANCDPTKDPFKCDRHKHYPMTNITLRNKPCIPWVQIDQLQDWNFEKNIKTQLSAKFLQSNYCVTTKGHSIPWCYTNTKSLIEEECFHQCPNHWPKDLCLVRQEHGEECTTSLHSCPPETEIVSRNRTIDGKPCLGWRIHPKWSEYPKPNLFHCYPVGDAPGGPWCYYGPGIDDWKYCYKTCPDISCPAIMPQDWKGVSFQRVTIRPPYKSSGDRPRPGTKTTVECSKRAKEEETSITVECLYTGNWSLDLDSLCVSKSDQTLNLFNQLMGNNNVTPLLLFLICLLPVLTLIILTTSLLVRRHRHQNNEDGKMTGNPKMSNADKKISSPRKAPGPKPKPSQQQAPFSTSAKDTTNSEDVATMLAKCRKTKDEGNAVPKPGNHKHGKEKHHDKKKPSNTGTVSLSDHLCE